MGAGLRQLQAQSTIEVSAGGHGWRLRRISAVDMALFERPALLILPASALVPTDTRPAPKDDEEIVTRIEEMAEQQKRLAQSLGDADVKRLRETDAALICASVTHYRATPDEGEWEPCQLHTGEEWDDESGLTPLSALTPGVQSELGQLCYQFQIGGEAAVRLLSAFLDRAASALARRQGGAPVRDPALDAAAGA